jgi:hypothetical protein
MPFCTTQILTAATIFYPDYVHAEILDADNFCVVLSRIPEPGTDVGRRYVANLCAHDFQAGMKLVLQSSGSFEAYEWAVEDLMRIVAERVAGSKGWLMWQDGQEWWGWN